jgi:transcriptional regulator with XRE-family HTH domain
MEKVGTQLWALRTSRNCSLSEIARRAGVSKAALSQWESGTRQPRIPELEAVMTALDADSSQRSRLLAAIDAPRALRRLRQSDMVKPPMTGDLLRALRHRKGWTQEQLSSALGVTRAAVGRWEQGERVPSTEQIHTLCYAVGAREEELVALSMGSRVDASTVPETRDWDEAQPELEGRLVSVLRGHVNGLDELVYWALERQVWEWSSRDARALPMLAYIYTGHAQFYRTHSRLTEIAPYTDRALSVLPRTSETAPTRLWAEILQATAAVHSKETPAPRRGLYLLSSAVDAAVDFPEYQAWILSDMAKYLALEGEAEAGLELTQRSIAVARKAHKPVEAILRQLDYCRLLVQMGRPAEALQRLPHITSGAMVADVLLVTAEAHYQAGRYDEAADHLQRTIVLTEQYNLVPLRMQADRLQARMDTLNIA